MQFFTIFSFLNKTFHGDASVLLTTSVKYLIFESITNTEIGCSQEGNDFGRAPRPKPLSLR
jgi:hypothetical protein